MSLLSRILDTKRRELVELRKQRFTEGPASRPLNLGRAPSQPLRLIAEIKRRSPSAGQLSTHLSVSERARAYAEAGASAISILCDSAYFDGSYADLSAARAACSLPLLCKEFVIDAVQLDAARAAGADAVLLIVRCLTPSELEALVHGANARGLQPLVEVFDEAETQRALDAGAALIGVNARDLDTLEVNVERAARILNGLPRDVTAVQLSGLATPEKVSEVARGRADAALIGEALMREADPRPLLRRFSAAARTDPARG